MKKTISVIIPVYNEEESLPILIEELEEVLQSMATPFEIVVVDDGSNDSTPTVLASLIRNRAYLKGVFLRANAGQTAALDAGFRNISGEIVITMDGDGQNDPHDIPNLVSLLDQGYDVAVGWRKARQDKLFSRKLPSYIANRFIRKITGTATHDLGCSLRAYKRTVTDELKLYGEMHRFIVPILEGQGAKVIEVPVNHRARQAGVSKYNLGRVYKVLLDLITVKFLQGYRSKPSYAFGSIGFCLIGLSFLITAYVAFQKLFLHIWVHKNPLFLIATYLCIIGVQFLVFGILAELLVRTYFESSQQRPYFISHRFGFDSNKPKTPERGLS